MSMSGFRHVDLQPRPLSPSLRAFGTTLCLLPMARTVPFFVPLSRRRPAAPPFGTGFTLVDNRPCVIIVKPEPSIIASSGGFPQHSRTGGNIFFPAKNGAPSRRKNGVGWRSASHLRKLPAIHGFEAAVILSDAFRGYGGLCVVHAKTTKAETWNGMVRFVERAGVRWKRRAVLDRRGYFVVMCCNVGR